MSARFCTHRSLDSLDVLEVTSREPDVVRAHVTAHMPMPNILSYTLLSVWGDMLERGSKKYSKDIYEEKLESLGAQVQIDCERNYLHVSVVTRAAVLREVLLILKETLLHPRFLPTELLKVKKEYTQAFHEELDDTRTLSYGMFSRHLYTGADASFIPSLATRRAELKKITPKSLHIAHRAFLGAPWVVSVAGDERDRAAFLAMCTALHTDMPAKEKAMTPHTTPAPACTEYQNVPGKQNIEFFIGNRLPLTLGDADYLAFSFGLDVLGKRGGFSGRLMSIVREKEGLTYSIYASLRNATATRCGHWNIWAFFTPKDAPQGIASTMREVRRIVSEGISGTDLRKFKELLVNQFYLAHESTSSVLGLYHASLVAGRTPSELEAYPARIAALTKKEVNRALRTHLDPATVVITGAGPTKSLSQ